MTCPSHLVQQEKTIHGLDFPVIENAVRFLYSQGLATSSQKSYRPAQSCYLNFCAQFQLQVLLLSEPVLCSFVSLLANQNLIFQTIKCYLSDSRSSILGSGSILSSVYNNRHPLSTNPTCLRHAPTSSTLICIVSTEITMTLQKLEPPINQSNRPLCYKRKNV